MPYRTGVWGTQQKKRSKKRRGYFIKYSKEGRHRKFTTLGSIGEAIAVMFLENSSLVRRPEYDVLWRGKKVEVKTANFSNSKYLQCRGWYFSIKDQKGKADYFFCICLNKSGGVDKIYFIPDGRIAKARSMIRVPVSGRGKWAKFRVVGKIEDML